MKHVMLHGLKFCRDDKTGYYRNSTHQKLAHRHVWESERGPIPHGWHVHHIDRDRGNNDVANLLCLSEQDHKDLHIREDSSFELRQKRAAWFASIRPKAKDWHRSATGIAWHKAHAEANGFGKNEPRNVVCAHCKKQYQTSKLANAYYCSNKCKSAARRDSGVDDETRSCPQCGASYVANKYRKAGTCSRACANRARDSVGAMRKGTQNEE